MPGRLIDRLEGAAGLARLRDLVFHNEIRIASTDPAAGGRPYAVTILQADGDLVMAVRPSWLVSVDDRQRRTLLAAHLATVRRELGAVATGLGRARLAARWLLAGGALWAGGAALAAAPLSETLPEYARTAGVGVAMGLMPAALGLAAKIMFRLWLRRRGRMTAEA